VRAATQRRDLRADSNEVMCVAATIPRVFWHGCIDHSKKNISRCDISSYSALLFFLPTFSRGKTKEEWEDNTARRTGDERRPQRTAKPPSWTYSLNNDDGSQDACPRDNFLPDRQCSRQGWLGSLFKDPLAYFCPLVEVNSNVCWRPITLCFFFRSLKCNLCR
jgi:hypothetical protein